MSQRYRAGSESRQRDLSRCSTDEGMIAAEASIGRLSIAFISFDECAIDIERET